MGENKYKICIKQLTSGGHMGFKISGKVTSARMLGTTVLNYSSTSYKGSIRGSSDSNLAVSGGVCEVLPL